MGRTQRILEHSLTNMAVMSALIFAVFAVIEYIDGPEPFTIWHVIFVSCIAYRWGRDNERRSGEFTRASD